MANSNAAKRAAEASEMKPKMPDKAATSANTSSAFPRYLYMKDLHIMTIITFRYTGGINNKKMVKGTPNSQ